jgi:hypothetical protein
MRGPTSEISIAAIEANESILLDTAQLNFNASPETKMARSVGYLPLLGRGANWRSRYSPTRQELRRGAADFVALLAKHEDVLIRLLKRFHLYDAGRIHG